MLPFKVEGSCNRCGRCCEIDGWRCLNLRGPIGGETRCAVYTLRYNGMPVVLQKDGEAQVGYCSVGEADDYTVWLREFGDKCSLTFVPVEA